MDKKTGNKLLILDFGDRNGLMDQLLQLQYIYALIMNHMLVCQGQYVKHCKKGKLDLLKKIFQLVTPQ